MDRNHTTLIISLYTIYIYIYIYVDTLRITVLTGTGSILYNTIEPHISVTKRVFQNIQTRVATVLQKCESRIADSFVYGRGEPINSRICTDSRICHLQCIGFFWCYFPDLAHIPCLEQIIPICQLRWILSNGLLGLVSLSSNRTSKNGWKSCIYLFMQRIFSPVLFKDFVELPIFSFALKVWIWIDSLIHWIAPILI